MTKKHGRSTKDCERLGGLPCERPKTDRPTSINERPLCSLLESTETLSRMPRRSLKDHSNTERSFPNSGTCHCAGPLCSPNLLRARVGALYSTDRWGTALVLSDRMNVRSAPAPVCCALVLPRAVC